MSIYLRKTFLEKISSFYSYSVLIPLTSLTMGKNRITIHDVAAKAGVAISSVSRVLSGHLDVSEKMRAKVEAAVAELGYEPDHLAQSLRKGATDTIGFLIRDITNPLFSIVAQSAEHELRKAGYSMILINSHGDLSAEKENFALFKRRRIDGVIASLISEDSPYVRNTINELGAPVVLLDREVTGLNASAVICDHAQGVKNATADLIKNRHTKIAFISGSKDVFISRNRFKGFEEAMSDAGIGIDNGLIRFGKFDEGFAYEQTKDLFTGQNKPTALISGGIGASTGALRALKELEIKPGKDIAFVALDEWPMFDVLTSDLSSVYRDPEEMGRQAARLILDLIAHKTPAQAVVSTTYRPRSSSKAVSDE